MQIHFDKVISCDALECESTAVSTANSKFDLLR